jgi:hypothetical protein
MLNMIIQKVILFCFIFLISFFIFNHYYNIDKKKTKKSILYVCITKISKLNIVELFFIMFLVLYIVNITIYFTVVIFLQMFNLSQVISSEFFDPNLGYLFFENLDVNISGFNFGEIMNTTPSGEENIINISSNASNNTGTTTTNASPSTGTTTTNASPSTSTTTTSPVPSDASSSSSSISIPNAAVKFGADALIATGAMKLANHVVKSAPTPITKTIAAVGGVALGAGAIVISNAASSLGSITKNPQFISSIDWNSLLNQLFNLTGNSVLDLLFMLLLFKKLEVLFLYLLIYNLIIINIDTKRIESYFDKYPNLKYYICKYINYTKKSSRVIIICSILLLIFSNYYSLFAVNFLFENFDSVVEYYLNNKN